MPHLLLLLLTAFCAFGPATKPASAPTTSPTTNPAERIWKINAYLHGTPAQIREQINGELERLIQLRAERQAHLKDATESLRASARTAGLENARTNLKETQ